MDVRISTLADRPDLEEQLWNFPGAWPAFMYEDPTAGLYYAIATEVYPEFILVAVDSSQPDVLVAKGFSVPFAWPSDPASKLPEGGWDEVIRRATYDRFDGTTPNLVSALEITIAVEHRGKGLAAQMVDAMRR